MPRSRRICCVVGCSNTQEKCEDDPNIKFYTFPGKRYEEERREAWIKAVRRINPDGSPWQPTAASRICSLHFIGGRKSHIASHPAYVPTEFPPSYRKPSSQSHVARYERGRRKIPDINQPGPSTAPDILSSPSPEIELPEVLPEVLLEPVEVASQCAFPSDPSSFIFWVECDIDNKGTLARVVKPQMKEQAIDAMERCRGFHGFNDLKKDEHLISLTGINFKVFNHIIAYIPEDLFRVVSREDGLLLFLMKLKLNTSYLVLSSIFGGHKSTISRIFLGILNVLCRRTKHFIFWPNRAAVKATMPEVFKNKFPQTRVIVDCTEVKTEVPKTVSQRIYMYSSYKGCHTFKFLVGISPNGYIGYLSKAYGGKSSDSFIMNSCGILDLLEEGDCVMADKGFPGVTCRGNQVIVAPPILHNGRFTEDEIIATKNVASVRIHVERCIQKMKRFHILRHLSHDLFRHVDKIVQLVAVFANLQPFTVEKENK